MELNPKTMNLVILGVITLWERLSEWSSKQVCVISFKLHGGGGTAGWRMFTIVIHISKLAAVVCWRLLRSCVASDSVPLWVLSVP